jgi:hypothetical protein
MLLAAVFTHWLVFRCIIDFSIQWWRLPLKPTVIFLPTLGAFEASGIQRYSNWTDKSQSICSAQLGPCHVTVNKFQCLNEIDAHIHGRESGKKLSELGFAALPLPLPLDENLHVAAFVRKLVNHCRLEYCVRTETAGDKLPLLGQRSVRHRTMSVRSIISLPRLLYFIVRWTGDVRGSAWHIVGHVAMACRCSSYRQAGTAAD